MMFLQGIRDVVTCEKIIHLSYKSSILTYYSATQVLFDIGVLDHSEPFTRLVHQGMILGTDGEKMSKSRGNVINPDDVVNEYGAVRTYSSYA